MDNHKTEQNLNQTFITYNYLKGLDFKKLIAQLPQLLYQLTEEVFFECIENLLKNDNFLKHYFIFIKFVKKYQKSNIDQNKIKQIFINYKDNFNTYINNKEKNKNFEDLENDEVISILKDFPKYLLYIYDDKNEIYDFIIEQKNIFDISNKTNFDKFFELLIKSKKINEIILYEKFLLDLEKKETIFKEKEELELYEFLFREYKYYKNNTSYIEKKDANVIIPKKDIKNINHFGEIFCNLLKIQTNEEIINEMIKFIFNEYNSKEKIKILFKQLKDNFKQSKNLNIFKLYKYSVEEFEKDYIFKIKSHNSLCKKNIIPINLNLTVKKKTEILYFYGNTTIKEIYGYLIEKYNSENYTFDINLKIEKEKEIENKILDKSYYNKTLNELIELRTELIISIKEIIPDKLITIENKEKKLTKTFESILKEWFRSFSNGRNKMNKKRFADLVNKITNKKDDFFIEDNIKILVFFKKYSYNSEYIKE